MRAALWICVAGLQTGAASSNAADPESAIPVSDTDALRAKVGERVLIKGTVREIEKQEETEHRLVWFTEGELMGFLRKRTYGTGRSWRKFNSSATKTVFFGGEIVEYKGKLELLLHSPQQFSEDAEDIDLEEIPLVRTLTSSRYAIRNNAEPERPGAVVPDYVPPARLEFKTRSAELRVAMYTQADLEKSPDAPPKLLTVKAEVVEAPGIGSTQFAVEPPPKRRSSELRSLMRSLPRKLGGWPLDCVVVLSMEGSETPPTLAAAVLIEAMLAGREVSKQFVLTGDLESDLVVVSRRYPIHADALREWAAEILKAEKVPMRLVGGETVEPDVFEELRFSGLGDAALINNCQVIGCGTLDDVLAVTGIADKEGLADILVRFDQTQKVVREKGDPILKHPKVAERIEETIAALPLHVTADYYAKVASGEVTRHRGKASSGRLLANLWNRISNVRNGASAQTIGTMIRARQKELDELAPDLHPDIDVFRLQIDAYFKKIGPIHRKSLTSDTLLTQREVDLMRDLDLKRLKIDHSLRPYQR